MRKKREKNERVLRTNFRTSTVAFWTFYGDSLGKGSHLSDGEDDSLMEVGKSENQEDQIWVGL